MWDTRKIDQLSLYFFPSFSILISFQYRRRVYLPSQSAANLGLSHKTASRWLSGKNIPSTKSCRKLAEYNGVLLEKVVSIAGHLTRITKVAESERTEFRNYAHQKHPDELDEDLITMIEDLIER
jgi:transcriptional regulator with XRE-family HTH domain